MTVRQTPLAVGSKEQGAIGEALAGLTEVARRLTVIDGGLALITAGQRRRPVRDGLPRGPGYEMRGFAATGALSEVALRTCVSARGGCRPETCGSAVLRFSHEGLLMVGDGTLSTPEAVANSLVSLTEGIQADRLSSVGDSHRGFRAAHAVHVTGHDMGIVPGVAADGALGVLSSAVNSLWVNLAPNPTVAPASRAA